MSKSSKRPSVAMPTVAEDRAITAAAKADPDAQPLTPTQLKAMIPARALRGRPAPAGRHVSRRESPGQDGNKETCACSSSHGADSFRPSRISKPVASRTATS